MVLSGVLYCMHIIGGWILQSISLLILYWYCRHLLLTERLKMDRRRLECAHIRFAILKVARWYPDCFTIENIMFSGNESITLQEFVPLYQKTFHQKYSGTTHSAYKAKYLDSVFFV